MKTGISFPKPRVLGWRIGFSLLLVSAAGVSYSVPGQEHVRQETRLEVLPQPESPVLLSDLSVERRFAAARGILHYSLTNRSHEEVQSVTVLLGIHDVYGNPLGGGRSVIRVALAPGATTTLSSDLAQTGAWPSVVVASVQGATSDSGTWTADPQELIRAIERLVHGETGDSDSFEFQGAAGVPFGRAFGTRPLQLLSVALTPQCTPPCDPSPFCRDCAETARWYCNQCIESQDCSITCNSCTCSFTCCP